MLQLPPLSLYIHIPWCVQKCPYCDFNSHALKQQVPEADYVAALLADLDADLMYVQGRQLQSIFIGGGTPSLFSAEAIKSLLDGVAARVPFAADIEITMEANPGTVEAGRFAGYQQAGVTRISIGVQSFQPEKLQRLGRIHDPAQAIAAGLQAKQAGLRSFNIDLMHGLPEQSVSDALSDLQQAIDIAPPHLSWYQLTIEPNTAFGSRPPVLPEDETLWDIQEQGHQLLLAAGYRQYEISAYAKPGYECRHNLNYWQFGDYLGIGCGAHGKITLPAEDRIIRTAKVKHPKGYLDPARAFLDRSWDVDNEDRPFEYFMNRMRLFRPIPKAEFTARTNLPAETVEQLFKRAYEQGLLEQTDTEWLVTELGHRYLNTLLTMLMED
ncbi:radical SAM family heme chaperone HemW [Tolumonas osonensis]|uniref:Heme chaperone HemW n=1 Tax=Tolumonas osonensis TaxID=675874 RepID=A0A841GRI7_9GAMM|nr:radical SAM family heme chaperone HemW [Tolumonas osonensis]MBB6056283.1 oxygen-independent coproporphyrinogen-3 oxidase [Tolumonas osonensis]